MITNKPPNKPPNKPNESNIEKCPNCGKPALDKTLPFCSKRCADVDLGRWFNGNYSVPVMEDEDMPDEYDSKDESYKLQ